MNDSEPKELMDGDNKSSSQDLNEDQQELSKIIKSLRSDPKGIVQLGEDGVFRSLTADRDVVDAIPLSPNLIKAFLDRWPGPFNQQMEDIFRGVDGTTVPQEKWFHPDKEILPLPMTEDEKKIADEETEKLKEIYERRLESGEIDENNRCRPTVRSNYNLGPKIGSNDD